MSNMSIYAIQNGVYAIGSASSAATLTTAYAGNVSSAFHVKNMVEITVLFEYTPAFNGNSVQFKIEGSADPVETTSPSFHQELFESISGGTGTLTAGERTFTGATASTTYKYFFLVPPAYPLLRISAKETLAGGGAGTLKVRLVLSGN